MRQEGESYSFGRPAWEGNVLQCSLTSLDENTPYYFIVRAHDADGRESGDSNEVLFYFDPNPPAAPEIVSPAAASQNVILTPDFTTSPFHDPDPGDYHAGTQWQIFRTADELAVFNLTSHFFLTHLTLPPLILDETTSYTWQARHQNQNQVESGPGSATFGTAVWAADEDADGIPDAEEIDEPMDLDGNGQNDQSQPKMKCLRSIRGDVKVAVDVANSASVVSLSAVQAVDNGTLVTPYTSALELPIGLIGFKLMTLNEGDVAEVTLHFSSAIPQGRQWVAFSMSEGYEDYSQSSTFSADRRSIVLQVQDGGTGDLDGVANGTIVSMGAYGSMKNTSNLDGSGGGSGGGGGGGGCFIDSLASFK